MRSSAKKAYLQETVKLVQAKKVAAQLAGKHPQLDQSLNRIFDIANKPLSAAVMGEFSTGKSSFLNKLLNINVLPVSILPRTATLTKIVFGNRKEIEFEYEIEGEKKVQHRSDFEFFKKLQTASKVNNPEFLKQIKHLKEVRININNPVLEKFHLIDAGF